MPRGTEAAPADDVIEVSLFGPGVGECVLLHLGGGEWLAVDSCYGRDGAPVALEYLARLGVEPAEAIRWIVATHWHDDHHKGIGALLDACPGAEFWASGALRTPEFRTLAATARGAYDDETGIDEFHRVLNTLKARLGARPAAVGPMWASARTVICRRPAVRGRGLPAREVVALSPSHAQLALAAGPPSPTAAGQGARRAGRGPRAVRSGPLRPPAGRWRHRPPRTLCASSSTPQRSPDGFLELLQRVRLGQGAGEPVCLPLRQRRVAGVAADGGPPTPWDTTRPGAPDPRAPCSGGRYHRGPLTQSDRPFGTPGSRKDTARRRR